MGHTSWNNAARTFDAVRATIRRPRYRVDAFASSVVIVRDGEFNRPVTGNNFHGIYASSDKLVPRSTVDAYLLWRVAPGLGLQDPRHALDGQARRGFDYGIEMAVQAGDVRALGGPLAGRLHHPRAAVKPRLIAEYNYASGDNDPGDGRRGTFDSLYPTPHDKYGMTDQVGWRNIHHLRSASNQAAPGMDAYPPTSTTGGWPARAMRSTTRRATPIARLPDGSGGGMWERRSTSARLDPHPANPGGRRRRTRLSRRVPQESHARQAVHLPLPALDLHVLDLVCMVN